MLSKLYTFIFKQTANECSGKKPKEDDIFKNKYEETKEAFGKTPIKKTSKKLNVKNLSTVKMEHYDSRFEPSSQTEYRAFSNTYSRGRQQCGYVNMHSFGERPIPKNQGLGRGASTNPYASLPLTDPLSQKSNSSQMKSILTDPLTYGDAASFGVGAGTYVLSTAKTALTAANPLSKLTTAAGVITSGITATLGTRVGNYTLERLDKDPNERIFKE